MPIRVVITRDYDQASEVAARHAVEEIQKVLAERETCVLGLPTGSSPLGFYRRLAEAAGGGLFDSSRIVSFNLDEYVGLPRESARERARHPGSYALFMDRELFGRLRRKFRETHIPAAALIDPGEMLAELRAHPGDWSAQGRDHGRSIVIRRETASPVLRRIREEILEDYARMIDDRGGIDLQVIGVGGRGHVGFHEAGIPFEDSRVLLVQLDEDTVRNAAADGHFPSEAEVPRYAVSMGAELIYRARKVMLLAMGPRKAAPVAASLAEDPTDAVPISYGQICAERGGDLLYVIDRDAAAGVLASLGEIRARGTAVEDVSG
jgi:glucosamine-6-phosphate deaminase